MILNTSATGATGVPFAMPAGVPLGTELWAQWALVDGAAVAGVALSSAVRGVTP